MARKKDQQDEFGSSEFEDTELGGTQREKGKVSKVLKGEFLKDMSKTQQYLLYGALGAAALYGGAKIPFVRKVALPFLATAATKNWGMLRGKLLRG